MTTKQKGKTHRANIGTAIGIGAAISMAVTLVMTALTAWLSSIERIERNTYTMIVPIITGFSTAAGCLAATKLRDTKKLMISVSTGATYLLILLSCNALIFEGQYSGIALTLIIIAAVSCVTAFINTSKTKEKMKFRKKRYR
jgi:putative membrane protein (TIGR04086 family)